MFPKITISEPAFLVQTPQAWLSCLLSSSHRTDLKNLSNPVAVSWQKFFSFFISHITTRNDED